MLLQPQIKRTAEKKLIGKKLIMSFSDYKVGELWRMFMQSRREIQNTLSNDMISMAVYKPAFFLNFNPCDTFEKWACVEVSSFEKIPEGMVSFILPEGLYAVFQYKGLNTDHSIYEYIFKDWIPKSKYSLDDRPHFEILGNKYKNNDPTSEEEIWIPLKA